LVYARGDFLEALVELCDLHAEDDITAAFDTARTLGLLAE
jgi:hypothetical protein